MHNILLLMTISCGATKYHPCEVDASYSEYFNTLAKEVNDAAGHTMLAIGGTGCAGKIIASDAEIANINAKGFFDSEAIAFFWNDNIYVPEITNMPKERQRGAAVILAHEVGHALTLHHSSLLGDLMLPGEQWHCAHHDNEIAGKIESICLIFSLKNQGVIK